MLRPAILFIALMSSGTSVAQGPSDALPELPLCERYCFGCHGPDKKTAQAGINLETLSAERPLVRNRET